MFLFLFMVPLTHAGNPLFLQGSGDPFLWSTTSPVPFHPDGGGLGLWDNATAVANTLEGFKRWGPPGISTSALTFSNAGAIPGDGNVNTVAEYLSIEFNCMDGGVSPVIFDEDGSLFSALGIGSGVIAFASPECEVSGTITEGIAVFNGKWFDGNPANGELTEEEFKGTFVHEFGHWLNLDHSQTNGNYFRGDTDPGFTEFGAPPIASVEVMFPFAIGGSSVPVSDDIATISRLYPAGGFTSNTGTIIRT